MLRSATSDLGLRCLPMSHKKDARFVWVKTKQTYMYLKKVNRHYQGQENLSSMENVKNIDSLQASAEGNYTTQPIISSLAL